MENIYPDADTDDIYCWQDIFVYIYFPTQGEFLARVRGQGEAEHGHGGDEDAGHDEVEEVVEGPPPDLDGGGDVQVGGGAAVVPHLIPHGRHPCVGTC